MTPLLTRAEARAMDQDAIERLGLPSIVLMENAGRGAAEHALSHHRASLEAVVVVGGPGQNGGDGWVLARHLHRAGVPVAGCLVGATPDQVAGDARINLDAMIRLGIP